MSVSVRVPTILRSYTGGEANGTADGAVLGDVLESLDGSYPGIKGRFVDEQGELRRFVNVYVGAEDGRVLEGRRGRGGTPPPGGGGASTRPVRSADPAGLVRRSGRSGATIRPVWCDDP